MELDRLERRLGALAAVQPAHSGQAAALEGELAGLYEEHLRRWVHCVHHASCIMCAPAKKCWLPLVQRPLPARAALTAVPWLCRTAFECWVTPLPGPALAASPTRRFRNLEYLEREQARRRAAREAEAEEADRWGVQGEGSGGGGVAAAMQ